MNEFTSKVNWARCLVAFVIAVAALLKMFGVHIPVPGSVTENAVVAGALALAAFRI